MAQVSRETVKIGISGCLLGAKCNFNGSALLSSFVKSLECNEQIQLLPFCPEDSVFGTPRPNLRIVGGDGFDVLEGRARVIDEQGKDVTALQVRGAEQVLANLRASNIGFAILMEGSPSCGSNVLLKEEGWPHGGFKEGVGVTAALLKRNGIRVFSSFDERSLNAFLCSVVEDYVPNEPAKDLRDLPKFKPIFEEE